MMQQSHVVAALETAHPTEKDLIGKAVTVANATGTWQQFFLGLIQNNGPQLVQFLLDYIAGKLQPAPTKPAA